MFTIEILSVASEGALDKSKTASKPLRATFSEIAKLGTRRYGAARFRVGALINSTNVDSLRAQCARQLMARRDIEDACTN